MGDREMCNCIEEFDKAFEEGGHNTELNTMMYYRAVPMQIRIKIETLVKEKKRGAKPVGVTAEYCPFCGEKHPPFIQEVPND